LKVLENLLEGCLNNNERDQKKLYEQYYAYCLKIVFRYIFTYDSAVDVVNDGFVKVFVKLNSFNTRESRNVEMHFMGWMKTIMVNTAIDRLRKHQFLPEIGLVNEGIWLEDTSANAEQQLIYKDLIVAVRKLPPTYRIVFNMFVIDGYTHKQIGEHLKISAGTSKSNLSKARGILQTFLEKNNWAYAAYER